LCILKHLNSNAFSKDHIYFAYMSLNKQPFPKRFCSVAPSQANAIMLLRHIQI
jgi:hypothetical protein